MTKFPDAAEVMTCPRCLTNLVTLRVGALSVRGCPLCSGVWLDDDANRCMVDGLDAEALAGFRAHTEKARARVDEDAPNLCCPVCNRVLRRHRVESAWLDVDICDEHGTWYDRGEVERVTQALNSPPASGDWRAPPAQPGAAADKLEAYFESHRGVVDAMRAVRERAEAHLRRQRYDDDDW